MTSRNMFIISGNVSQKPRQFGDGKAKKAVITVAVDDFWTDKQTGERKKRTDYLTAFTFNPKIGAYILNSVGVGNQVTIDGHLRANSFDKGADKIYTTELEIFRVDAHPPRADRGHDEDDA